MIAYDNVFLPTKDERSARVFYEMLGLPVKFSFKGMTAMQVGEEEPAVILKSLQTFPDAKPTIWFVVDDLEQRYRELTARGVCFLSKPFAITTGKAVEFEDPDGNRLGFTEYTKIAGEESI